MSDGDRPPRLARDLAVAVALKLALLAALYLLVISPIEPRQADAAATATAVAGQAAAALRSVQR